MFLAKYIPATPPPAIAFDKRRRQQRRQSTTFGSPTLSQGSQAGESGGGGSSPCPSPTTTPLFQQLYAAMSHWERVLADSPELLKELTVLKGKYSPDRENEDDSEGGGGGGEEDVSVKMRTASMYNLAVTENDTDNDLRTGMKLAREESVRRKSSPGGLLLAAAARVVAKKSEMNEM